MIGKQFCRAVRTLLDLTDAWNSLLMHRVFSVDVISTWEIFGLIKEISHEPFLPSYVCLAFPCLTYLCVSLHSLRTCTLGLSWLSLWKVPGQAPSSNKSDRASEHTRLLRLTLAWESSMEFPAVKEMKSSRVFTYFAIKRPTNFCIAITLTFTGKV